MYYVYILECSDRSLYTGITTDVARRLREHKEGSGGRYTRSRHILGVVYTEEHPNRSSASKREAAIKRWSHEEKKAFIRASSAGAVQ